MDTAKLEAMANQIATFFRSYPDEQAQAGIRDHLKAFWTGRMVDALLAAGPKPGLDPLVTAALWQKPQAESPIAKELAGPEVVGLMASDAG